MRELRAELDGMGGQMEERLRATGRQQERLESQLAEGMQVGVIGGVMGVYGPTLEHRRAGQGQDT